MAKPATTKKIDTSVSRTEGNASLYGVHPGIDSVRKWILSLPEETGRSLEEWVRLVKKEGPPTEKERREWLKAEYKFGTNSAWWIAEHAEGKSLGNDPESYIQAAELYVETMFSGAKAGLLPLYHRLLSVGLNLGDDVKACPCKTIVPLYRRHVFAQIKPATRTRIDLGLALKDLKSEGRLINTGGFEKKDRITHRIPIFQISDIDNEVKHWLTTAYELDA